MRRMADPEVPLTREQVTPASRRTIPAYIITSTAFGAAIFATLLRDGDTTGFPPVLLWVQRELHFRVWWVGLGFLICAACMTVALAQQNRTAYTLSLGGFLGWLTALGLVLEVAPFTGTGSFLAGLPFLAIAYLARVTQRSVAQRDGAHR